MFGINQCRNDSDIGCCFGHGYGVLFAFADKPIYVGCEGGKGERESSNITHQGILSTNITLKQIIKNYKNLKPLREAFHKKYVA